jgi:hypothetical protein
MPLEKINGDEAFEELTAISRYPTPDRGQERYLPYPTVAHTPTFQIDRNDRIFTIGSCFARNVEKALINLGLHVLSSMIADLDPNETVTNKYSTKSILSDLRTTFDPNADIYDMIEVGPDGAARNLTFGGSGARDAQSEAEVRHLTEEYFKIFRNIAKADVVIMTLGLVEVWFDKKLNRYLNISPTRALMAANPGRFELHVLSYDDIRDDLDAIYEILKKNCKPGFRMLVTVSPVPLAATFRQQDVLQANAYSKSVQRAAVEEFCARHPEVRYFPSYEMVTLASPKIAWRDDDYRHVRQSTVDRIMQTVMQKYVEIDALPPARDLLVDMVSRGKSAEALQLIDEFLSTNNRKFEALPQYARMQYGRALERTGQAEAAKAIYMELAKELPNKQGIERMIARIEGRSPE